MADGTLATAAKLIAYLGLTSSATSGGSSSANVQWSRILNIPANVTAVAGLATSGVVIRNSDGTWVTADIEGANPTASVGLTAVNGSAITYMRSDGAPPIDVGISPTWTGVHSFANHASPSSPSSGNVALYCAAGPSTNISQFTVKDSFGATIALGYENHMVVYNNTGGLLTAGSLVYINGNNGSVPTVAQAKADSASTMPAIGYTQYNISNGAYGPVHVFGLLTGNTSTFSSGDKLYVSDSSAGALTKTAPTTIGHLVQQVGTCTVGGSYGTGQFQLSCMTALATVRSPTEGGTGLNSYTAGDILYASATNVLSKLAVGTDGYVLTLASGLPSWAAGGSASPLTTKGDLFGFDTGDARIPVGTDTYVLTADSGDPLGVSWQPAAAGSGTVTSVALADTTAVPIFDITGSPITTSGTIDLALKVQAPNTFLLGPVSGTAEPTFRTMGPADLASALPIGSSDVAGLAPVATSGLLSSLTDVTAGSPSDGEILVYNKLGDSKWDAVPNYQPLFQRGGSFSGGLGAIVVPTNNVPIYIPEDCTIVGVEVLTQGGTGSCLVGIWKTAYGSYPPTSANSIVAGAPPTISSGIKYQDTTLTGWTTACSAGDTLLINLTSSSVFTNVMVVLTFKQVGSTTYDGYTDAQALAAVAGVDPYSVAGAWTFAQTVHSTVSAGGTAAGFAIISGGPGYGIKHTGGATDGKVWDFGGTTGSATFSVRILDDAESSAKNALSISRSGYAVTFVDFGNATDAPAIRAFGPVAAAAVDMTPDKGTIVLTPVGLTSPSPATVTAVWSRQGNLVSITIPPVTGTSSSTSFALTGTFPASITPTRTQNMPCQQLTDNSVATVGTMQVRTAGTGIDLYKGSAVSTASWTASNVKALNANITLTYLIN